MARNYGQIQSAIWQDDDFKAELSTDAQWLYFVLLSQPNLNTAGVLPLQDRRWKKLAADAAGRVEAALGELQAYWYVVVDEDTEEVLVRTFIRNDGLWRQPNVLKSALDNVRNTMSPVLRAVLRTELEKLPLNELTGKRAEESRTLTQTLIGTLPRTLPEGFLEPPQKPFRGAPEADGGLTTGDDACSPGSPTEGPQVMEVIDDPGQAQIEGFPEGFGEGFAEPSGVGAGVGEGAGVSFSEAQKNIPQSKIAGASSTNAKKQPKKADPLTAEAQRIAAAYWERYKTGSAQSFIAVRQVIKTALGNEVDPAAIEAAMDLIGREGRAVSGPSLQIALQQSQGRHLQAVSGGHQPYRNPTDQSVYDEGLL